MTMLDWARALHYRKLPKKKWVVTIILDVPDAKEFDVTLAHAENAKHAEAKARLAVCLDLKVVWDDVICLSAREVK